MIAQGQNITKEMKIDNYYSLATIQVKVTVPLFLLFIRAPYNGLVTGP